MYLYENVALLNVISILSMGLYILRLDGKRRLNIFFFAKCLAISAYIISATASLFAAERYGVICYKVTMIAGTVTILLILFFYVELTNTIIRPWLRILICLPAVISIFLLVYIDTAGFSTNVSGGYVKVIPEMRNPFLIYWSLYLTFYCMCICAIMYRWRAVARLNKDRIPAAIILVASISFASLIVLTDIILPEFQPSLPYMAPLFFSLYIGSVFYCLVKYRFLVFGKNDMIREIFTNVRDFIIILDPEWKVIEANNIYYQRTSTRTHDIKGKRFMSLIDVEGEGEEWWETILNNANTNFTGRIVFRGRNCRIFTDSTIERITDRFGDFAGILVVSRENQGMQSFRSVYRMTARQMDLILLIIDGYSNAEISQKLKIARRTVETHIFNIYSKLRINNRVELMKISHKFNLPEK